MTAGHLKFNWNRYIDFAEDLLKTIPKDEEDEVKERCGISRAYYGAFHRAQNYLNKIGITVDVKDKGSHNRVIDEFNTIGKSNRLWAGIGLELNRLKIQRQKADYHDRYFEAIEKFSKLRNELEKSVSRARYIVKKIDEIEEREGNQ